MAIRLNGVFKDNMIFQRNKEIRIFGEVSADKMGAKIRVKLIDKDNNVVRDACPEEVYEDGFFLVCMESLPAGGPYTIDVRESNRKAASISNVYIGELWLASGQSNMEYPMGRTEGFRFFRSSLPETKIHFYNIPAFGDYTEEQRQAEDESQWSIIDRETCTKMSGVAYYFARQVEEYLREHDEDGEDLRIGIIGCYLGGTSVACWQSLDSLNSTKEGRKYITEYADAINEIPEKYRAAVMAEYQEKCDRYNDKFFDYMRVNPYATYHEAEHALGCFPWPPPPSEDSIRRPGALFNTMVLRIVPLALKGVIFYQGEDDTEDHAEEYAKVFTTMINEWREAFWDNELPFVFCQLPMFTTKDRKFMGYDDMHWPMLRDQQALVSRVVPNTYMAVLTDCGEFDNIHPSDKKTPGDRLARLALRFVYGYKDVDAVAPYAIDIRRGEGIEISFAGDFSTLKMLTGLAADESGFEVAGEDLEFHKAQAAVDFDGKTIILNCPKVEFPTRVRYAYFSYGMATLSSDTGLAAAPFQAGIDKAIGNYW